MMCVETNLACVESELASVETDLASLESDVACACGRPYPRLCSQPSLPDASSSSTGPLPLTPPPSLHTTFSVPLALHTPFSIARGLPLFARRGRATKGKDDVWRAVEKGGLKLLGRGLKLLESGDGLGVDETAAELRG
eukprot:1223393-Rhodomonas_salina.1